MNIHVAITWSQETIMFSHHVSFVSELVLAATHIIVAICLFCFSHQFMYHSCRYEKKKSLERKTKLNWKIRHTADTVAKISNNNNGKCSGTVSAASAENTSNTVCTEMGGHCVDVRTRKRNTPVIFLVRESYRIFGSQTHTRAHWEKEGERERMPKFGNIERKKHKNDVTWAWCRQQCKIMKWLKPIISALSNHIWVGRAPKRLDRTHFGHSNKKW